MNIVFIHSRFPGPFGPLAEHLAKKEKCQAIFITSAADRDRQIPGVQKMIYPESAPTNGPKSGPKKGKDGKAAKLPPAVGVANALLALQKQKKIVPDLIIGHSGSGISMYARDVFPASPFLCFFDWFHSIDEVGNVLDNEEAAGHILRARMNLRNKNLPILSDLDACSLGICPTQWQKSRFPKEFQDKLSVLHTGVPTQFFKPAPATRYKTDDLDLTGAKHLITYTANLLAPYQGFQQFVEALPAVLEEKPDTHVVLLAADRIGFGDKSGDKKSYKTIIEEKVDLDPKRVHFLENATPEGYRTLLQASSLHIYLDSPLVAQRSLLEAMSCGCLVMAPDQEPVKEIITDGANGIIADFSSADKVSEKICHLLDFPSFTKEVKEKARQTIVDQYDAIKALEKMTTLIQKLAPGAQSTKKFG